MAKVYIKTPKFEELDYRKKLLADEKTMEFNKYWGWIIDFKESKWSKWYKKWIENQDPNYFYAYLYRIKDNKPVGEISYYYDKNGDYYKISIIIEVKYRRKGYGEEGLKLLIEEAFKKDYSNEIGDNIGFHNKEAQQLFKKLGFKKVGKNKEFIFYRLKKTDYNQSK
ncbi:MAG: GNAT family N-acetyltransferase [Mollicutes bacterium]|nr:GNAT family N-acetyltransferase [Mollicutes bacterium]